MGKVGRELDRTLNMRVSSDDMERLDRLVSAIEAKTPGVELTRSSAARAALLRGLEALEGEYGPQAAAKRKPRH